MKPSFLSLIISFIILIGCNKHSSEKQPETPILKFDLDFTPRKPDSEGYSVSLAPFIDSVSCIKLETGNDFLIKRINWIEQFNDMFYILDKELNQLFVFDTKGRFKFNVGAKGKGPKETLELTDFTIDRKNNLLYTWDNGLRKILIFDARNGEYLSQFKIDGVCRSLLSYGRDTFLVYSAQRPNKGINIDLNHNLFIMTKDYKIINKFLPIDKYMAYISTWQCKFSSYDDLNMIIPIWSNTVYQIKKEECKPRYYLDFGKYNIPLRIFEEYNKEPDLMKVRLESFNKLYKAIRHKYVYFIHNYCETDNFIYFNFYYSRKRFCLLYNKKNKKETNRQYVAIDIDSIKFPIFDFFKAEGDYLVSYAQPGSLNYFKDKISSNSKFKKTFEAASETDNPILFLMHLKK
ncbi:MAG TPA: 6-bladed beta-propeller [Bacteroidales bacterium]|nr:6-bladed beta-propeller [Bacteroidales bacterium]